MKASQFLISTLKEAPADAEVVSHQLMMRAGMIKRLGAGIYNYMPMGLRVIRKVEAIVREEMNRAGAIEMTMPVVQPAELWQETGRFDKMGPELLRVKMLTGLTTSEINERAVYHAVSARPYRRMVERLTDQLSSARNSTTERLLEAGMTPIARARGGMFVSAGWDLAPTPELNGKVIADRALAAGILLSPAEFFTLGAPSTIWFRFNAAYAADAPALVAFLTSLR